jgi:hypothetical protein
MVTVDAACAGMGDQSVNCPSTQVKVGGKSLSLGHRVSCSGDRRRLRFVFVNVVGYNCW